MRLATIECSGQTEVAFARDEKVLPLVRFIGDVARDMTELLRAFASDLSELRNVVDRCSDADFIPFSEVGIAAPVLRPGKIIGIGRNYGAHASEGGMERQEKPRIFFKPSGSVSGPGAIVRRPRSVTKMDFEGELVVVVGRTLYDAGHDEATAAIAGYTVGNDLSARELQFDVKPPQTSFAKGMDGFAAIGPWIVTADELGTVPDLRLRTFVNGKPMQDARTSELIFSIADCLSYVSRFIRLEPGDLLYTGTPLGVGVFRDPPVYLEPGDVIRVEIERIGTLVTTIGSWQAEGALS